MRQSVFPQASTDRLKSLCAAVSYQNVVTGDIATVPQTVWEYATRTLTSGGGGGGGASAADIYAHRDYGLGIEEGLVRLHVPIVSHPEVEFYVDGVRVPMAEGECWYLDLGLLHRVSNPGPNERIHLVVDCEVGAMLLDMLPAAADGESEVLELSRNAAQSSWAHFERFRECALEVPALLAGLRRHGDAEAFIEAVVQAGARSGFRFGPEDVRSAMQAGRRAWIERNLF
jgi:hypothetical protein